jgi:hypothetical protein
VGEPFPIDSVDVHGKLDLEISGRRCLGGVGPLSCGETITLFHHRRKYFSEISFRIFFAAIWIDLSGLHPAAAGL